MTQKILQSRHRAFGVQGGKTSISSKIIDHLRNKPDNGTKKKISRCILRN